MTSSLNGKTVIVIGGSSGIGAAVAKAAAARGAQVVLAGRRLVSGVENGLRSEPVDVTDAASIQAAVEAAGDVTVLINNAGASTPTPGILSHTDEEIRANVETNFFGPLFMARAFAPILSG